MEEESIGGERDGKEKVTKKIVRGKKLEERKRERESLKYKSEK